jgi:diaminohydroxyphosphoribosylaminopyrimidine deaminase/5-amino-6-(5-phosphoribosylamino)uracil reductase
MSTSEYMRLALAEAAGALGTSSPNPAVGAVVVRAGEVVGRGFTQPPGNAHAEVMALREAGERARGATVYSTLEPCGHQGRTPPCTRALVDAMVSRVVYAIEDPDPLVRGDGHRQLEEAGIAVEVGDGAQEATRLLEGYLKHRRTGMPFVIAKFATSLDGHIAAASGDSKWISGPETAAWMHRQRATLDAIIVGSRTVLIDDPQLTARPEGATGETHQPLRVVVDSSGRIAPEAHVLRTPPATLVVTIEASSEAWRDSVRRTGAEVLVLPERDGHVDVEALLGVLGGRGALTVLCEGGGTLLGALFDERLVDRVQAVVAPIVIGASEAPSPVAGHGAYRMADVSRLRDLMVERLGDDVLVTGLVTWPEVD